MTKISFNNGHLSYAKYGSGSKILLAFHGFGQNKSEFKGWIDLFGDEHTIYAFDLFYHGESIRDKSQLTKEEWRHFLSEFLQKERIDRFSVFGYSLGGRFAIASAILYSEYTDELILIAPDGIFLTIWFKLTTTPGVRWVFNYLINNPKILESLLAFNKKTNLIHQYIANFAKRELEASTDRKRVYTSWNSFKTLGYTKKELVKKLGPAHFRKRIILGSKDYIIKPHKILPLIDKIGGFEVDILPLKHHQLVGEPSVKLLANYFQSETNTR